MWASKQRQKLRHCKSLQNLWTQPRQSSIDRKNNKNLNDSRINKSKKKHGLSRFATQINNDKPIVREEKHGLNVCIKSQQRVIKEQKSGKSIINRNQSGIKSKRKETKPFSPTINRVIRKEITEYQPLTKNKKDKKGLKKQFKKHEVAFRKSPPNHMVSAMTDLLSGKDDHSKSKMSKNKSKKKIVKMKTEMSLQSTPSCLAGDEIQVLEVVGQGTFGKVFKARMRKSGEIIAIKRVVQDSRYKNRQIQITRILHNDFIVQCLGSYLTQQGGKQCLNIMMRYYDQNLYQRISFYHQTRTNHLDAKLILYQLFKGLSYLHSLRVCHRDIKPQNILLKGSQAVICDFGSAKILMQGENNISYICARCYRAPELIFGATKYTTLIDMWSAGCVILEMIKGQPLFIGETSVTHLLQIMKVMGAPTKSQVLEMNPDYCIKQYRFPSLIKKDWKQILPQTDPLLIDLIDKLLVYSPSKRLKAIQALTHPYFDELRDEFTYKHVRSQFHLYDFFAFGDQYKINHHLREKLIPKWYDEKFIEQNYF